MSLSTSPSENAVRGASLWRRFVVFLDTIKFEHAIFALPFAVAAVFMAYGGWPDWVKFGWIILAMVTLRTFAMAANRLLDAEIDRRNPRTADRALATGAIRRGEVVAYMIVSAAVFVIAASQLDPLALLLAPIPLAVAFAYPYLKRYTWLAHFGIGAVYIIVPPAVPIALTGALPQEFIWMGLGAMMWVSGFDMLYAIADMEFDRANGLHSVPAKFGVKTSLWAARVCHVVALAFLAVAFYVAGDSWLAAAGIVAVALMLVYEHSLVSENDLSKLNMAFFTMNGVIAIVFATFVVLDQLISF